MSGIFQLLSKSGYCERKSNPRKRAAGSPPNKAGIPRTPRDRAAEYETQFHDSPGRTQGGRKSVVECEIVAHANQSEYRAGRSA
jgi:hypothetical protein